jgi:hypothetical protein
MNKLVTKVLIFAFAISMLGTINSYAQQTKGANLNAFNNHGNAPIHTAIYARNLEMVKVLIENGADINLKNKGGIDTPLTLAIGLYSFMSQQEQRFIRDHKYKERKLYTCYKTDYKKFSKYENIVLDKEACKEIAKYLVDAGADLDIEDFLGRTPFQLATVCGLEEVADIITAKRNLVHGILNDIYYTVKNW